MDLFNDISKEQIKQLPTIQFDGQIFIVDRPQLLEFAINRIKNYNLLGFDTETRPSFKKGQSYNISLVQLAAENEVFLFRINLIGFPDLLKQILETERITKVGFDLNSDFHQIRKIIDFKPKGFIDLQKYAKNFGLKNVSLRKLTAIILKRRLSKRQRLSNWNSPQLSDAQIIYAATDAWVTLILYKKLNQLNPTYN